MDDDRDAGRVEADEELGPAPCPVCGCEPGERQVWEGGDGVWFMRIPCGCDCHDYEPDSRREW